MMAQKHLSVIPYAVCFVALTWVMAGNAQTHNLALGNPAFQSSNWCASGNGCASAKRAVDGNTDGDFFHNSVAHTSGSETHPWWRVDLESSQKIGRIVIWNRTDCCPERLTNFRVSILDASMKEVWGKDFYERDGGYPDPSLKISVPEVAGRYVQVRLSGDQVYLSLAEVQVYSPD